MQKFISRYWKVIAWCALIFTFSSFPTLPTAGFIWWDFILKKSAHMAEYAILYYLAYDSAKNKGNWLTPFLFCLAYALSDEYHQSFIIGRTSKLTDVGIDSIGMALAYFRLRFFS